MRGFRASRASQNFKTAHFGKMEQKFQEKQSSGGQSQHQQQQQKAPELPAWLRVPEQVLKAQETQPKKESHLRLVKSGPIETVAKPTAKAKPVKRVVKKVAKAKTTKVVAKKRKAA